MVYLYGYIYTYVCTLRTYLGTSTSASPPPPSYCSPQRYLWLFSCRLMRAAGLYFATCSMHAVRSALCWFRFGFNSGCGRERWGAQFNDHLLAVKLVYGIAVKSLSSLISACNSECCSIVAGFLFFFIVFVSRSLVTRSRDFDARECALVRDNDSNSIGAGDLVCVVYVYTVSW